MPQSWNPRYRYKPIYYKIVRLDAQGFTQTEICQITGYGMQQVGKILVSDEAKNILEQIKNNTLDTALAAQTDMQAMVPLVLEEKFRLALGAEDERVRNIACTDILDRAGHAPRRNVDLHIHDHGDKKYDGMSEAEMRTALLAEIGVADDPDASIPIKGTVH